MSYRNGTYVAFDGQGEVCLVTVTINILTH